MKRIFPDKIVAENKHIQNSIGYMVVSFVRSDFVKNICC